LDKTPHSRAKRTVVSDEPVASTVRVKQWRGNRILRNVGKRLTKLRHIPEDVHFHCHRCENHKHKIQTV
jgi:hypothetical protein